MLTVLDLRAGMAVVGVSLGGLAIGGAVALVTAPLTPHLAVARTAPLSSGLAAARGTASLESILASRGQAVQ